MFRDVSGPAESDIREAVQSLQGEAQQRGGQVEVTRDDEGEWVLMNLAGERLEAQGQGRMDFRSSESFVFVSTIV